MLSWKKRPGHNSRTTIQEKRGVPWLSYHQREDTRDSSREKRPFRDSSMCVHTHAHTRTQKCTHMRVRSLPLPALPLRGGAGGWAGATSPQGNSSWKIWHGVFTFNWLRATFLSKKNIICLLAWSVTKIIFTSMTLTVSGQEAERLCRPHCFPAPLGRRPENRAAVSEERLRSLGLWLMLSAVPPANCWEGEWHARETRLPQPYTCDTERTQQNRRCPKSGGRILFFFFRESYPSITCLSVSSLSLLSSKFLHHHPLYVSAKTFISVFYIVVTRTCGLKIL